MDRSDRVYTDFLSELDGLERFRQRFQERHPSAPLDREDPDVRRLIEAMAFFSVQTRNATLRNLRSTWQRLFGSFFGFLLTPVPAATMVQAVPSDKLVEPVLLQRGTEFRVTTDSGSSGAFRLQRDLRVLPIFLGEQAVVPQVRSGYRLIVPFESRFPRKDTIDVLSLYIRHLDSYRTSLTVFHALRKYLKQVSVVYDANVDETSSGPPCEFSFGSSGPPAPDDAAEYAHPFERVRGFFHFPERDLFLHVRVPPSHKPWTRFTLCFDIDQPWTYGRSLHPDFFQLFAAPAINQKKEAAQRIVADGTTSEYPIINMNAGREFALHSVLGVYEMAPGGLEPLRAGYLPGAGSSYEVEETFDEDLNPRHSLILRMPDAFDEPRKIAVEAVWYQPGFASQAIGRMQVMTPARHIEGLSWQLASDVQPHLESAMRNDVASLVQMLAWKAKPTLSRDELVAVISFLGLPPESPFVRMPPLLRDLSVSVAPDAALSGSGVRHIYAATLEPFDPGIEPLLTAFLIRARDILDIWNAEASVELRATVAGGAPVPLMLGAA